MAELSQLMGTQPVPLDNWISICNVYICMAALVCNSKYPDLCYVNIDIIGIHYYISFYPAMTAFTDQYSLPNIFFDIGQL